MSGWKRKGFWTNHGWDMIFSHKNLGCCLIGHLHICNFDFRTPIFILYEMYRKLKMLEYKHLLKSPIFPFDSRLWKGQFGNGKGMEKIHSQSSGTGREWKIHSQSLGKGIRGLHSWEWPGTGIPAHPLSCQEEPQGSPFQGAMRKRSKYQEKLAHLCRSLSSCTGPCLAALFPGKQPM